MQYVTTIGFFHSGHFDLLKLEKHRCYININDGSDPLTCPCMLRQSDSEATCTISQYQDLERKQLKAADLLEQI